jgi:hypothetical protein
MAVATRTATKKVACLHSSMAHGRSGCPRGWRITFWQHTFTRCRPSTCPTAASRTSSQRRHKQIRQKTKQIHSTVMGLPTPSLHSGTWLCPSLACFLCCSTMSCVCRWRSYMRYALSSVMGAMSHSSLSCAGDRIHERDPVLFSSEFSFQWIASSDNVGKNAGWCNYEWPAADMPSPSHPPKPLPGNTTVSVDALAFLYVWPEADA